MEHIAALRPGTVIALHERPGAVDGISKVRAGMDDIHVFGESKETSRGAVELYQAMIRRCDDRINPVVLGPGCQADQ